MLTGNCETLPATGGTAPYVEKVMNPGAPTTLRDVGTPPAGICAICTFGDER